MGIYFVNSTLVVNTTYAQSTTIDRSFPVERFRLALDRDGIFQVEWPAVPTHLSWNTSLWFGYAHKPLLVSGERSDGVIVPIGELVSQRVGGSAVVSLALWDVIQLGLELPLIFYQQENPGIAASGEKFTRYGFGNLRLAMKYQWLRQDKHGVDFAVLPSVIFPTHTANDYFGSSDIDFAPEIAMARRFGLWRIAANTGYVLRTSHEAFDLTIDDEIFIRLGSGFRLGNLLEPVEINLTASLVSDAHQPFKNANQNYLELLSGIEYSLNSWVTTFAAFGMGFGNGFGAPSWRGVAGIKVGQIAPSDQDHDGIYDADDPCLTIPEDSDGIADSDGCPELDFDNDGINDEKDRCPLEPEDQDDVHDEDGCPELDADEDTIPDTDDACPLEKGVRELKGCPKPDDDGDGVPDDTDICPNELGQSTYEGCPDEKRLEVRIGEIELAKYEVNVGIPYVKVSKELSIEAQKAAFEAGQLLQKIRFKIASAGIQHQYYSVLFNIAKILKDFPELRIEIQAHTCSFGGLRFNLKLSKARAISVKKFLEERAEIPDQQIHITAFGEAKPVASNKTERGRKTNRRVEFVIEKHVEITR